MLLDDIFRVRQCAILGALIGEFLLGSMKSSGGHTEHYFDIHYKQFIVPFSKAQAFGISVIVICLIFAICYLGFTLSI